MLNIHRWIVCLNQVLFFGFSNIIAPDGSVGEDCRDTVVFFGFIKPIVAWHPIIKIFALPYILDFPATLHGLAKQIIAGAFLPRLGGVGLIIKILLSRSTNTFNRIHRVFPFAALAGAMKGVAEKLDCGVQFPSYTGRALPIRPATPYGLGGFHERGLAGPLFFVAVTGTNPYCAGHRKHNKLPERTIRELPGRLLRYFRILLPRRMRPFADSRQ